MRPNPSARPGCSGGFSLLEFVVVVVIIGVLATLLLNRILFYQEQAEKTAMEQTLGTLRSALHLQMANLVVNGKSDVLVGLTKQNPMTWLSEKPANYVGEYYSPRPGMIKSGNWYYDMRDKNLVYLATNTQHLHATPPDSNQLRFSLSTVTGENDLLASTPADAEKQNQRVVGIVLLPTKPYAWF